MTTPNVPEGAEVKLALDKPSVHSDTKPVELDTERMLREIDGIVSGDWGYSVTDDMAILDENNPHMYKDFTQKQAREMSQAIGRVYMIAHAIHCTACQGRYVKRAGSASTDEGANT